MRTAKGVSATLSIAGTALVFSPLVALGVLPYMTVSSSGQRFYEALSHSLPALFMRP